MAKRSREMFIADLNQLLNEYGVAIYTDDYGMLLLPAEDAAFPHLRLDQGVYTSGNYHRLHPCEVGDMPVAFPTVCSICGDGTCDCHQEDGADENDAE